MEPEASSSDGSTILASAERTPPLAPYEINSMVLCSHTDNLFYVAKIIAVEPTADGDYMYTVHYQGWSKRYDENILHSKTAPRFREYTPENIERAKYDIKEAKAREVLVKKKKFHKFDRVHTRNTSHSDTRRYSKSAMKRSISPRRSRDSSSEILSRSSPTSEKMSLPEKLKSLLENDHRMIEEELKLPRLPARSSVSKILKEYVLYVRKLDAVCSEVKMHRGRTRYWKAVVASLDESVDTIKSFFDLVITSDLLYPNEELRHKDLTEGPSKVIRTLEITDLWDEPKEGLRASECYGFIYLLRLLVKLQDMIEWMSCDGDRKEILTVFIQSFIRYLGNNSEKLFDPERDYEPVTREYRQRLQRIDGLFC